MNGGWVSIRITGASVWRHDIGFTDQPHDIEIIDGRIEGVFAQDDGPVSDVNDWIKLPGGVILPAFFDGHLHLDQGGRMLKHLPLAHLHTADSVLHALAEETDRGDGWLIGIGLHELAWPSPGDLQRVTGSRPALLYARDYHTLFLNRPAMQALGITRDTGIPTGGWADSNDAGELTGVFHENAVLWIENLLPPESPEELQANLLRASNYLRKMGVLGVSDAGHVDDWPHLKTLETEGRLPIRAEVWARCQNLNRNCLSIDRGRTPLLNRSRIKLFLDGALGSRTAWLLEDYSDQSGWRAQPVPNLEVFEEFCQRAVENGWSLTVHAIGDAAVRYGAGFLDTLPAPNGPHRLEHVQHIDSDTLARLKESPLVPSIQPLHRTEDLGMLIDRVGHERAAQSFPARSLWSDRRALVLGTDWPIVSADPRETIAAALSPRHSGEEGMPGEEMTLNQIIPAYTLLAAQTAGFEYVGAIDPCYSADLVWLPADPGDDIDAWREVEIGAVWFRGNLVHQGVDF
ncbi:amidohydrolase family protein [bacterium]|nr:amidohydrolase family protein [bacterium]